MTTYNNSLTLQCNDWATFQSVGASWGWRKVSHYPTVDSLYSFFQANGVTVQEEAPADSAKAQNDSGQGPNKAIQDAGVKEQKDTIMYNGIYEGSPMPFPAANNKYPGVQVSPRFSGDIKSIWPSM